MGVGLLLTQMSENERAAGIYSARVGIHILIE